jgi:hypothetical protein
MSFQDLVCASAERSRSPVERKEVLFLCPCCGLEKTRKNFSVEKNICRSCNRRTPPALKTTEERPCMECKKYFISVNDARQCKTCREKLMRNSADIEEYNTML